MDWLDTFAAWFVEWMQGIDAALRGLNEAYRPLDRAESAVRALVLRVLYRVAGEPARQKKLE